MQNLRASFGRLFLIVFHHIFPMSNYFTSITLGVGLGFILCVAGSKMTEAYAKDICKDMTDTHQIVLVDSFMGSTYTCVDRRYL